MKDSKQEEKKENTAAQPEAGAPKTDAPQPADAAKELEAAAAALEAQEQELAAQAKALHDKQEEELAQARREAQEAKKAAEAAKAAAAQSQPAPTVIKKGSPLLAACCVLLFAGLIGGGWYGYQEITALKTAAQAQSTQEQALAQAQQALSGTQQQMAALVEQNQKLQELNAKLQQAQQVMAQRFDSLASAQENDDEAVDAVNSRLDRYEARDPNEWRIAESFFNIQEAYRQAVFGRSPEGALWNLDQADKLLVNLEDEDLVAIRAAIAKDISTLSAVQMPDLTGITLRLEQLYQDAGQLVLAGLSDPERRAAAFAKQTEPTGNFADWKENLLTSAKQFSSRFIEIRRRAPDAATEFLSPSQELFLREHVQTRLLLAKLDAAKGDQEAYSADLAEARRLIDAYFDKESALVQAALESIDQLAAKSVAVQLPRVLESHALFEKLAGRRLQNIQG